MYPNEFVKLVVAGESQFAECNVFKKLDEFF